MDEKRKNSKRKFLKEYVFNENAAVVPLEILFMLNLDAKILLQFYFNLLEKPYLFCSL